MMRPIEQSAAALFCALLAERLTRAFPEATIETVSEGRWLLVVFPEGAVCGVCVPRYANLLMLQAPAFDPGPVIKRALAAVSGQRQHLASRIDA